MFANQTLEQIRQRFSQRDINQMLSACYQRLTDCSITSRSYEFTDSNGVKTNYEFIDNRAIAKRIEIHARVEGTKARTSRVAFNDSGLLFIEFSFDATKTPIRISYNSQSEIIIEHPKFRQVRCRSAQGLVSGLLFRMVNKVARDIVSTSQVIFGIATSQSSQQNGPKQ